MNKKILPLIILWFVIIVSPVAKAEEIWDGIRITCLRDLGYFDVETMTINLGYNAQNIVDGSKKGALAKKLKSENGIYTVKSLLKEPYVCDLGDAKIGIEVKDYAPAHEHGECAGLDNFSLLIRVDGKEVHEFDAYGINRCTNGETHLVDLVDFGNFKTLEDCTMIEFGKSSCKKETLE